MLKLYLKKVLLTVLFLAALLFLASAFTLCFQRYLFMLLEEFINLLCAIPAPGVMLTTVYFIRCNILSGKSAYLECHKANPVSIGKDLINTLKSKENIIHTLAFLTISLLFFLLIGISASTPFLPLVVGTIILLVACDLVFTIVNTLIWCLVHKRWVKRT